ncbi:hypothetical protein A2334_05365 [Candidatus Roizmanbacteria bacterium RIFOXYB2_FULL_38_10]|uniref:GIY-YIG domain-containing protein n=1 Tax=Candidatus Roizmanbacteria bacterium RIFOXYD1_FULL_38_12 TaxID=1802093 RepID=A0A1F7L0K1_9BACT|nr:MAG: hypothetical protein A3K47_02485 [Candidatus Roizmanbacteria bacterium RIFOXYA2_FULL_38_14]OGK63638.1 MAG: hypothetical protein A3K27_02485 [Candidatus Roizmanbacteria bacterium RIFOXYA1_FULL_37_12]OGK65484.1 MAG: hypothetical protein A3K38_02485 [Candidatus Roizmanbacteria bacterium RIFOXYB1_FULL_40_23]OGK68269.1 MAG: hypothetical protein A2334_05365 [Candidatus Roizmanbacteria bacterium RIFOXYB2_FULL_38_10]OGK69889.1 MAG: hypothetical protein A3K21_02490 [Candidatus Roizmanbacteria ba
MKQNDWFLYIVRCRDKSLYTGITTDIERRIKEHNLKKGAKSLKSKIPVILVFSELYNTHSEAAKREAEIKGWNRKKKLELILNADEDRGLPL